MSYEEICREIADAPETWLPGLLQRTVRTCAAKPVFQNKASLSRFVETAWDLGGVGQAELRTPTTHVFRPDPKHPHICEVCGYPQHEQLQHSK